VPASAAADGGRSRTACSAPAAGAALTGGRTPVPSARPWSVRSRTRGSRGSAPGRTTCRGAGGAASVGGGADGWVTAGSWGGVGGPAAREGAGPPAGGGEIRGGGEPRGGVGGGETGGESGGEAGAGGATGGGAACGGAGRRSKRCCQACCHDCEAGGSWPAGVNADGCRADVGAPPSRSPWPPASERAHQGRGGCPAAGNGIVAVEGSSDGGPERRPGRSLRDDPTPPDQEGAPASGSGLRRRPDGGGCAPPVPAPVCPDSALNADQPGPPEGCRGVASRPTPRCWLRGGTPACPAWPA
jgi:hypothetical protein